MKKKHPLPETPAILTTTVGSYATIDWLLQAKGEQALIDATSVVFVTQRRAGIDLPTDGELYRFDVDHPDTNGMIEYFLARIGGIDTEISRSELLRFQNKKEMSFRRKPAGVVRDALHAGTLNLENDCSRAAMVADGPFKFTVTSPYMLVRTLLDTCYDDFAAMTLAVADVLADQVADLPCACVQIDEANIPGNPDDGPLAAEAINRVLDAVQVEKAVHFCFGNYGGQVIQAGSWRPLIDFLNRLRCDHLVLELAHRPEEDLQALGGIDKRIKLGLGVIDIKVNHIETPDEIAKRIESAAKQLGPDRIRFVHPDCGFWMLKRSVADRKISALVKGRDTYLGL
jgi:5-methyltetrahydropteroyltriglutamate--homocysteine methyltransferase